jgi:TetR/AcrR family transcriptional regulator
MVPVPPSSPGSRSLSGSEARSAHSASAAAGHPHRGSTDASDASADPLSDPIAPPSASPSARPVESRRDEIIGHAIQVFGESGFAGGRIDDVADRVGIRRPSILYHFPDKVALYAAAIGDVVSELARRVERAPLGADERLDSIADAWVDFVIERPIAARLLLRQMIDDHPVPLESAEDPIRRVISLIASAIEERAGPLAAKALDAAEFSLVLASSSLAWVASQSAVEGALGIDTLSPAAVRRHRRMLHALIRQMISASQEAQAASIDDPPSDSLVDYHR